MWLLAAGLGVLAVATGLLPVDDAYAVLARVAPVLVFLVAMTVLAELADQTGLFAAAAGRAAHLGRGRTWLLYVAILGLATATTVLLSLDTTAVLLTPVVLALAQQLSLPPLPFAFASVWLANTASLLLPVSNLTNLLAQRRLGLDTIAYAHRMLLPALAAVAVTCIGLLLWHRRALRGRYETPEPAPVPDRALLRVAAGCCLLLVPALTLGVAPYLAATAAATGLVVTFAVRRPAALTLRLLPVRLVVLVVGLFLVVAAAGPHGLDALLGQAAGHGNPLRLVGTAAAGANLANNLPAYLALDRVTSSSNLFDVLLGVNLGPLVLPYGSLATLLWWERCRSAGVRIPPGQFVLSGALLVPPLLLAATLALHA